MEYGRMRFIRNCVGAEFELVLIGGAYKSGTSLLCEHIESFGFENPCRLSNANEKGHGMATGLYLTRECAVARAWNHRLIMATRKEQHSMQSQLIGYLNEMIQEMGTKLVVKDPLF